MDPGLHKDIPHEEYLTWPYVSKGILVGLRDFCPAKVRWSMDHPTEETDAMRIGTATHIAVLEPERWETRYLRGPDGPLNRNPWKAEMAALREENPDAVVLKASEHDEIQAMAAAVRAHKFGSRLVTGDAECSAVWDEEGVRCRARFDLVSDRLPAVVDLKTTRCAEQGAFERDIYGLGYYLQAAHYLAGARAVGIPAEHFFLVCVEKDPPYLVAVYKIADEVLSMGEEERLILMARYRRCVESGEWPGYPLQVATASVPSWGWKAMQERVEVGQ